MRMRWRGALRLDLLLGCPRFLHRISPKSSKNKPCGPCSGRAQGDGTKVTESAQNADFRRKPQIFADSPLLLEIPAFGGRRKPQKTADFRRKPKIFAGNRRKPQIGLCRLRSVTFCSALLAQAILRNKKNRCESKNGSIKERSPRGPSPWGGLWGTSGRLILRGFVGRVNCLRGFWGTCGGVARGLVGDLWGLFLARGYLLLARRMAWVWGHFTENRGAPKAQIQPQRIRP